MEIAKNRQREGGAGLNSPMRRKPKAKVQTVAGSLRTDKNDLRTSELDTLFAQPRGLGW